MSRTERAAFSVSCALLVLSVPLHAQAIRAGGRVLLPDSTPTSGTRVVLHRVGRDAQGPLHSTRTDARGRFQFSFRPDTTSLYLVSARYKGIEYFSPPVHTNPERPDTAIRIIVSDTSSTAPVVLEARHLVVTKPAEDGTRSVLDLLVLRNRGKATRVAADTLRPSWSGPLPQGSIGLELIEGDVSPDAVRRRHDSLIVTAPLSPGEKQITVQYLIPSNRAELELLFPDSISSVNVLAEEKEVQVAGGGIAAADSQTIEGRSFRRWTGDIPAGGILRVDLPGTRNAPRWLMALLVGLLAIVLGTVSWYHVQKLEPVAPPSSAEQLIQTIATLDVRYLGRERDTPASEWSGYQARRAQLKAQLETALAAQRESP